MGGNEPERDITQRVGLSRRRFMRDIVAGSVFAVPVVASFDMVGLTASAAGEAYIPTTTTLMSSATSINVGQSVTLTSVTDAAYAVILGQVQFLLNNGALGAPVDVGNSGANGVAQLTTSALPPGQNAVVARYLGTPDEFNPSDSNQVTITVAGPSKLTAAPALITLHPFSLKLLNLKATLTAGGAPVAGQTIVFSALGTTLGTAVTNAQGVATLSASMTIAHAFEVLLQLGYRASFAGNGTIGPSSANGALIA
jgi:hypothetical protein